MEVPPQVIEQLNRYGQTHVLRWWDELEVTQQQLFCEQLCSIDFSLIARAAAATEPSADDDTKDRSSRAEPPRELVRWNPSSAKSPEQQAAAAKGKELLQQGKVGAIVVAGGQGTRLGFPKAKGLFPIGPVSGATIFDFLCGQLKALARRYGKEIPYFVMTSDATHDELVEAFKSRGYFGLDPQHVRFFRQGHTPAVDRETGKLLLAEKYSLALSPDGHGGLLDALKNHHLLEEMQSRGLEHIYYHQVDNPCLKLCDPEFLGHHVLSGSEMSTKVVAKASPDEKLGLLVEIDGKTQIIEYSDMPAEIAAQRNPDGSLRFWAGNTACHLFSTEFLTRVAKSEDGLSFHQALKKVPHIDDRGIPVDPPEPNAWKFEKFIFEALPLARVALVLETSREREFNPVKNESGNDSPDTARAALQRIWRDWFQECGIAVPAETILEVQPSFALDAEELATRRNLLPPIEGDSLLLK
ncbi:MAG TPA: UDPGP type 1 family protein [Planctomycetaceae bacterium]|nr:UDPGP type 1 family protein [Planctomycetaceae bacterium]